jgi:hypothetical protein
MITQRDPIFIFAKGNRFSAVNEVYRCKDIIDMVRGLPIFSEI